MKTIALSILILFSLKATAELPLPFISVEGRLVAYNKNVVELESISQKRRFKIPRSRLPEVDGYVVGKAKVKADVLPSELQKLNGK